MVSALNPHKNYVLQTPREYFFKTSSTVKILKIYSWIAKTQPMEKKITSEILL